jgi:hypothetical protein
MDTITVEKNKLIETLKRNRDEHVSIFERAQIVYREKVIDELDRAIDDAKNGRKIIRFINLPEPENHLSDFETAIEMLEWDTADTVDLDRRDFKRFVQNKWEWEQSFAGNTQSYSSMLDEAEERAR